MLTVTTTSTSRVRASPPSTYTGLRPPHLCVKSTLRSALAPIKLKKPRFIVATLINEVKGVDVRVIHFV